MKHLLELLRGCRVTQVIGPKNPEISAITFDSRKVSTGSLFVAFLVRHPGQRSPHKV